LEIIITRISAALDFTCVKVKYLRLYSRHFMVIASSIYGNLSAMSRSSDFWESMVSYRYTGNALAHSRVCNSLQDNSLKYQRSPLGVSQHTIPASRAQSSKGHNIPCISRTTILKGKFLSRKCGLYTCKNGIKCLSSTCFISETTTKWKLSKSCAENRQQNIH
jgi:hypothetical protein